VNGLSLIALIAVACAVLVAYRYGRVAGRREAPGIEAPVLPPATQAPAAGAAPPAPTPDALPAPAAAEVTVFPDAEHRRVDAERMRIVVAYEAEAAALRRKLVTADAERICLAAFAEERRTLLRDLATARGEVARYRQVVVDLENDAPPPILGGPGAPDDLKLIVGIGPALERMLQQLGIGTYRQIARWTEHDIEAFDARLPEFPGRIRRDAWVTQARELHYNKYGERP
jgi:predicted flap endonuclease-1-like 5' DNA nuclease